MNDEAELPEHVRRNRVHWDPAQAAKYVEARGTRSGLAMNQPGASGVCRTPSSTCSRRTLPTRM